jgi:hypothetical protein
MMVVLLKCAKEKEKLVAVLFGKKFMKTMRYK